MMAIPENHVVAEGKTLKAAIDAAAAQLAVPAGLVEHKIDMAHFRGSAGAETVRIFAWAKEAADVQPALDAESWVRELLAGMQMTGTVRGEMRNGGATVFVDVPEGARHLVGRQGSTLRAIQHLLERALAGKHSGVPVRIDVARPPEDDRRGERRDFDRGPRRDDRGDRGPRDDRGGDRRDFRPRGDRPFDRRDRGGDRGGFRRGDGDVEDLKRLARKLADKVLQTGDAQIIRRELNSFDRRIVHVEVATIAGVKSRSVGEGHDRRVEIYAPGPDEAGPAEG
jgi:predicted RNA-binding protein Jag